MKIRFYLHNNSNAEGLRVLMCSYSHASQKWRFSTNVQLKKGEWNDKTQKVSFKHPHAAILNNQLIEPIRSRLKQIALELQAWPDPKSPTVERVKAIYKGKKASSDFWSCWERFMSSHVANLAKNTRLIYRRLGEILKEIEQETGPLSWDDFTIEFYNLFKNKLASEGSGANTVAKRVQTLKSFLKFAHKNDWHQNDKYQFFEVQRTKTMHVALSEEELKRVEMVEIENEGEAKARDVFLFHCNTGLRYSELASISIIEGRQISFTSQKTGKFKSLSLNKKAREILTKYEGKLPVTASQVYGRHIKRFCKRAGIDKAVQTAKGPVEKWKACSTHTARRTCATMLYRRGVDLRKIQEVLSHASIKQTVLYLKTTEQDFDSTLDALDA